MELTANQIAEKTDVKPTTIVRFCKRNRITLPDGTRIGVNDPLPKQVVTKYLPLNGSTPPKEEKTAPRKPSVRTEQIRSKANNSAKPDWARIAAVLPLPTLGLVASYGVFSFARIFVPWPMAAMEAISFEVVYIALAAVKGLDEDQQKRARQISVGALVVSALYGSLAALFHRMPQVLDQLDFGFDLALSILHGFPVPLLAYLVATLLIHRKK